MPTHPRRLAAVVLVLLLATSIAPATAAASPMSRAKQRIQGTWVLQQVMTRSQLGRLRPELEAALRGASS